MTKIVKTKTNSLAGRPKEYDDKEIAKHAQSAIEWMRCNPDKFSPVQYLAENDLPADLFRRKQLVNSAHSDALKKMEAFCEARILEAGFKARNPVFMMFILKAKYGYIEEEKKQSQPQHIVHHHIPQQKLATLSLEQLSENIRALTK